MSEYVIPVLLLILLSLAFFKKVNVYNCFTQGAKEALKLTVSIFPYISAIFIAVFLFRESGASQKVSALLSPVFSFFGIDGDLIDLLVLKPLSGNGALALLEETIKTHGSDSYVSRCAAVLVGSSETTFYITAVYFSTVKVKKLRYLIPVSLLSTFVGAVVTCAICRYI